MVLAVVVVMNSLGPRRGLYSDPGSNGDPGNYGARYSLCRYGEPFKVTLDGHRVVLLHW